MKARGNAWFLSEATAALFIGKAGKAYENSYEICPFTEKVGTPAALKEGERVVVEQISPYREFTDQLPSGITIYYKNVWE